MTISLLFPLAVMALVSPSATGIATATNTSQDMAYALAEMQKANYFAYAMLINMAPPDLIQANITFLIPNDKSLAKTTIISETSITDFLLHHSIPWPLLFDHLEHFPTGSMIPTSRPGFVLKVTNDGTRRFFFNNARIISPNICAKIGSSIRCHGIDGVLQPSLFSQSCTPPPSPPPSTPPPPPPPLPSPSNATQHHPTILPSPPASSSPQPRAPSVEVDDDNPSKSSSGSDHLHLHPLMCNKVVISLAAMLCFVL